VDQSLAQLDRAIQNEESNLAVLKQTYRDSFPKVKEQVAKIDNLKQQREKEQAKQEEQQQQPVNPAGAKKGLSLRDQASLQQQRDQIKSVQTQLDNIDLQVQRIAADKAKVQPVNRPAVRLTDPGSYAG
jgi:chromosome segregation ATPase